MWSAAEWYPAVILSYNARTGKHKVKYEADQFVEELKLSEEEVQMCEDEREPKGPVEGWTIRAWLEAKGLVKYAGLFELNEVDMVVLPTLTLEDLKDMPVKAVGARRKILDGIFKLAELKRVEEAESPVVEASNERDTHTNEDTDVLVQTALKAGEPEEDFMPKGNTGKGGPLEATDKPASEIQ
eukprot:gene2892-3703_t